MVPSSATKAAVSVSSVFFIQKHWGAACSKFVFEQAAPQCFWMKNTLLPLTAAFVADDGTIVNLADMKPQTTESHCSTQPVRYVLEINLGWFDKKGIKAGFKLGGKPFTGK